MTPLVNECILREPLNSFEYTKSWQKCKHPKPQLNLILREMNSKHILNKIKHVSNYDEDHEGSYAAGSSIEDKRRAVRREDPGNSEDDEDEEERRWMKAEDLWPEAVDKLQ